MKLGKAATYGVFASIHIASKDKDGPVQGREVAKACGIPVEYLLKILQQLVRAQVLRSERGRGGGFMLRRPPTQTTLLEVVEAVDGLMIGEMNLGRSATVSDKARRKVENVLVDISNYSKGKLKKITLKQLM